MNYDQKKQIVKERVLSKIREEKDAQDSEVWEITEDEILLFSKKEYLSMQEKNKMRKEIFHAVRKLDILQDLIEDKDVTEIMVNGSENIFIEKNGKIEKYNGKFDSEEKLSDVIGQIVSKANRIVNQLTPIVDARLEKSRVHVVMNPVALNGPILTIRRFPEHPIGIEQLIELGSINKEVCAYLKTLVEAGYNIFISGGTGSGKTTFLNALSSFIPKSERIITIEDSAELQIQGIENLVRLETRNANMSGCTQISIRDLIKASLRMRPDRIVIGEVRGAEAADLLQALNTGHDGSLSTGHANSAKDMLSRLEMMVLMGMEIPLVAIRKQIASGIDIIIHLSRLRDKSRKVISITEIIDFEEGEIRTRNLFEFEETGEQNGKIEGKLVKKANLYHKEKLLAAGLMLGETE